MWANPALWTAIAGCVGALAALVTAVRAHTRATDAHTIAVGHALDRAWHPTRPRSSIPINPVGNPRDPPSSPAGPSSR